jgi:RNA polymerase sigma-70 factor (ECF subfamily)
VSSAIAQRTDHHLQRRDRELLSRAQGGDAVAFEQLAGPQVDRLFATALRLVGDRGQAEDVVQETLLRAWRGIRRFRRRSQFSTWLYRIAVNESFRANDQNARRPDVVVLQADQLEAHSAPEKGPARQAEYRELLVALDAALLALPMPHRAAVVLRDLQGLSTREAANIIGISEGAFKSRLHQGRMEMRSRLGDAALIAAA